MSQPQETAPATPADDQPTCELCGNPATCCARGDDSDSYGCDDCCGHGCDVGCFMLTDD